MVCTLYSLSPQSSNQLLKLTQARKVTIDMYINVHYRALEGTDIQIVKQCGVGVSLHSETHPLFM